MISVDLSGCESAGARKPSRPTVLQRENAELRQRIEELEELCGIDEKPRFKCTIAGRGSYSSERIGIVLMLLLKRELVSRLAILLAIGRNDDGSQLIADVYVSYARRLLREWRIPLRTDRGRGWYVERKYKNALRANLSGKEPHVA